MENKIKEIERLFIIHDNLTDKEKKIERLIKENFSNTVDLDEQRRWYEKLIEDNLEVIKGLTKNNKMEKDLNYWKNNAEEDYLHVPISVLRYITELEKRQQEAKKSDGICLCGEGYESCDCSLADKREREGIDEALVILNNKLAVRYAVGGDLYEEKQEWISCDTPPNDDRLVLLICTNWVGLNDSEQFYLGEYHSDSECWISQDGDEIHRPCYWNDFKFTHPTESETLTKKQ